MGKRRVLITGATAGIGAACATTLAANGYDVILTGRRENRLAALKEKITTLYHVNCTTLAFDVQDRKATLEAINSLPDSCAIDAVINNAGLALGKGPFQESQPEDWDTMLSTNVTGLLTITHGIMHKLNVSDHPHIINIASIAGMESYAGGHVYCATKAAVRSLTKSLRIDLLPLGIKVSAVSPGMVETEFSEVRFKGDKELAQKVYHGFQPLLAQDVADVVLYLLSLPKHVCLNEVVMTATAQANAYHTIKD